MYVQYIRELNSQMEQSPSPPSTFRDSGRLLKTGKAEYRDWKLNALNGQNILYVRHPGICGQVTKCVRDVQNARNFSK
jgi:hypothetical protein